MEEALRHLRAQHGVPLIAFTGDISRTWFADIDVLHAVMEILRDTRMYQPVRGSSVGFDAWLRDVSSALGLVDVVVDPVKKDKAGWHIRDVGMLDETCMLVAFPAEDTTDRNGDPITKNKVPPLETADRGNMIEVAQRFRIPILIVYRNGRTDYRNNT